MIQPINIPWNEFPKSEAVSEGMIPLSPKCDKVTCEYLPDVVCSATRFLRKADRINEKK